MILGRASELEYLNTCYEREGSQILVLYGEKNVGKTALLKHFIKNRPCHYYRARSASEREQCYQWGRELTGYQRHSKEYPSFSDLFAAIEKKGEKNKASKEIIIVDEFQYIVKAGSGFMESLLSSVQEREAKAPVMVILCSSATSWVENSMLRRIGEAAYELSGFLKIKELGFESMLEYFPGFKLERAIAAYAVLGGAPGLWRHFDDTLDMKENICRHILSSKQPLFDAGWRIVEEELRETGVYNTILASIAAGNQKLNDLYLHTGFSRAKISVCLKNLMELDLVEKVFSYDTEGKANAQKGIYRIRNHFVHFYFTFLYPNMSALFTMGAEDFYEEYIAPYLKGYVESYFKTVCTQRMEQWNRKKMLPISAERFGEWVGKFGNIDIVAQSGQGETLIALCNFANPMMRYEDYEWLLFCAEKAKLKADYVYLFSVGRFDEKLKLEERVKQNLRLITLDEM